jgi:hypothetical protein
VTNFVYTLINIITVWVLTLRKRDLGIWACNQKNKAHNEHNGEIIEGPSQINTAFNWFIANYWFIVSQTFHLILASYSLK